MIKHQVHKFNAVFGFSIRVPRPWKLMFRHNYSTTSYENRTYKYRFSVSIIYYIKTPESICMECGPIRVQSLNNWYEKNKIRGLRNMWCYWKMLKVK